MLERLLHFPTLKTISYEYSEFRKTWCSRYVRFCLSIQRHVLSFIKWRLLAKPVSVVRDMTLDLVQKLDAASSKSSAENRFVLGALEPFPHKDLIPKVSNLP